jgi:hypothetical protein
MKINRKKVTSIILLLFLMSLFALNTPLSFSDEDNEIELEPSGDITGVTDATNIENALEAVKGTGGTVELEEGCYYVSRSIVIKDFNGQLVGDGKDETTIMAVMGPDNDGDGEPDGFGTTTNNPPGIPLPILFDFPYPTGKLVVKDLTIKAKEYKREDGTFYGPANLYTDQFGAESHAMHIYVLAWKGNCKTIFKNLKIMGAAGDFRETKKNIKYTLVRGLGQGDVTYKNCEFDEIGGVCCDVFYQKNAYISIENCISNNGVLVSLIDNEDSYSIIKRNTASGIEAWEAIWLREVENVQITQNTFKDLTIAFMTTGIITLYDSHACSVSKNKFINVLSDGIGKGAIRLKAGSSGNIIKNNDYSKSGLPGWTDCTTYPPEGLGYLLLEPGTMNNQVYESIPEYQACDQGTDNLIVLD